MTALFALLAACGSGTVVVPSTPSSAQPEPPPPDTDTDAAADATTADTGSPPGTPTADTGDTGAGGCPVVTDATRVAVVTDIDETLTTSDEEWLTQIALPWTDPEMRQQANLVMDEYFARGYRVLYLSARGEDLRLLDGRSARRATEDWLTAHRFPYRSEDVFLAPGVGALFEAADYKTAVLRGLAADGWTILYAYGNADTDIEAYQAFGIPDDRIFLVGELAGRFGVVPITDAQAYDQHYPRVVKSLPCAPR